MNRRMITVLDNGGKTFDRYTIINRKTGDVWGASENPFHPQGFGQYSHNIADAYWFHAYGTGWRKRAKDGGTLNRCIKATVTEYLADYGKVRKKVRLSELPKEVLKYIDQILVD